MKRFLLPLAIAFIATLVYAQTDLTRYYGRERQATLRSASGNLTAGETTTAITNLQVFRKVIVFLDITVLTLPDADDEVDFFIQTTYDGINWTDVENIHFTDADDGTTPQRIVIIDETKDGPGTIQATEGTDPVTGAEVSETVPANTIWRLHALEVALTTDGTGTPRILVLIDDGSVVYYRGISESTQAISTTEEYVIGPIGMSRASVDGVHFIPLPEGLLFSAGHRIRTSGIDSADEWGAPSWLVGAWHDSSISTDGSIGDNLHSYDRPLGSQIRIKTTVTGASAPTYSYSATAVFQ